MRRPLTASALLALAVFTTTVVGQPPKSELPKPMPEKKSDVKTPEPTDAAIAAALANDPDVKMARAKIQLAEAELAKARLAIAQKVTLLKTTIDQHKAVVDIVTQQYRVVEERTKAGTGAKAELLEARITLLKAQAALATSEAEWKLLTGGAVAAGTVADPSHAQSTAAAMAWLQVLGHDAEKKALLDYMRVLEVTREQGAVKGPIPDRIRAALDKPVKLGAKGEKVTFAQALEIFKKDAGLDVPVRPLPSPLPVIVSEGEELPVGAWFQLYQDTAGQQNPGFAFYVREYGLLVANKQSAPPDAPTLTEFWKLKPPAKEPKVESVPKK